MEHTPDERDADRLLRKLREFVGSLDHSERRLLAALLAPGVLSATASQGPEVSGFAMASADPEAQASLKPTAAGSASQSDPPSPGLPLALSRALARTQVRVSGLDDEAI